jgi:hypothetical protein
VNFVLKARIRTSLTDLLEVIVPDGSAEETTGVRETVGKQFAEVLVRTMIQIWKGKSISLTLSKE